ncbi:MAG: hypothetical protein OSJ63_04655, partial [Bacilli bacterium]|nr:hypothetical protein [Bacilli bacterium]
MNNIHRAQQLIDCYNKEHPNAGGCCCSGRQIPGPTGPTGPTGPSGGPTGPTGPIGPTGPQGI